MKRGVRTAKVVLLIAVTVLSLTACGGREARKESYLKAGERYYAQGNYAKANVELLNVLQIDPKTASAHYLIGRIKEKKGNISAAFGQYRTAASLDKKYVQPRERLAYIYLMANRLDDARKLVKEILGLDPGNPKALTVESAITAREGHREKAIGLAKDVVQKNPHEVDAIGLLAALYAQEKKQSLAVNTLKEGIAKNPGNIPLRLTLAGVYVNGKQLDKAGSLLKEVIQLKPGAYRYRRTLAEFYAKTGRLGKAEKTLRDAIAAAPTDPKRYLTLADFLAMRKSVGEAESELRSDIRAHPDMYKLRFGLASLYRQTKNTAEAEKVYQEIIARKGVNPSDPIALRARDDVAKLYVGEGKLDAARAQLVTVLKNNPGDNAALILQGEIDLRQGKPGRAVGAFRSVLKDQPDSVDVLTLLALAHLRNHEPALARDALQRAAQAHPGNVAARVRLARFFAQTGDRVRALKEVEKGLKTQPRDLGLLTLKSSLLAGQRKTAAARATLDTIVKDYPGNPMGYQGLAGLYAAQGRLDEALKEYDRALKVAPKNPALLQQKAAVLVRQKKFAQAAGLVEKIQADYPKSPLGYFRRGELYFAQKDYAKARAQFEEALQRSGKDVARPLQAIARTYLAEKKPGAAVKRVRSFLKGHPDNAYAYDLLGNLYLGRADYAKAEQALHKASSLNPSWVKPYLDLSRAQLVQKRPAKAIAALQAGLKGHPAQLHLLFPLATLYQGSGDPAAAIATYRKVLGVSPKNVLATNNLAMLLVARTKDPKSLKEAVTLAEELEKVRNPAIQDTVGWVYYRSGDAAKAVPVLEAVVKAAPKIPIFQYHLGMALYKAGKTQAAKVHLERALAGKADFPGAAEARKVLAGLK